MRFHLLALGASLFALLACGSEAVAPEPLGNGQTTSGGGSGGSGGSGGDDLRLEPVDVACAESVAYKTSWFSCVVLRDHTLWCSGSNSDGMLGLGTTELIGTDDKFVQVASLGAEVASVSIGTFGRICAVKMDHSLWCWGTNERDWQGHGSEEPVLTPTQPPTLEGEVEQIVFASFDSCALKTDGAVLCWSSSSFGEAQPTRVEGLPADVVEIAVGPGTQYARTSTGEVYALGGGYAGALGLGEGTESAPVPVKLDTLPEVVSIAAGGGHACALAADGAVWCWGNNGYGQAAPGGGQAIWVPTRLDALGVPIKAIALGLENTCAVSVDGDVYCWGDSYKFALGGSVVTASSATAATVVDQATSLTMAEHNACAVRVDGSIRCWGSALPFSRPDADPNGPVDIVSACQ